MSTSYHPPNQQEFPITKTPDNQQLENIKAHLDLLLLALEALIGISSETFIKTARKLNLESVINDRVEFWRLRQSNPLRKSQGGRKKLDIEEARSLVIIICHLAKQNQELVRRSVNLLEQKIETNQPIHQSQLLGEYLDKFINIYQERMESTKNITTETLSQLALKLLIDLLFYSNKDGYRRLWLALIDYSC